MPDRSMTEADHSMTRRGARAVINRRHCSLPAPASTGAWVQRGACRGSGIGAYFPQSGAASAASAAKAVCAVCTVRGECLAYALADLQLQGVWGGTTEPERRSLRGQAA